MFRLVSIKAAFYTVICIAAIALFRGNLSTIYEYKIFDLKERTATDTNFLRSGEKVEFQSIDDVASRFAGRLTLLHSRCPPDYYKSRERSHWVPRIHFLVDAPKRLLVCVVPKSGSSTWHGLVWALRRKRAGLDEDMKFYTSNDTVQNHAMARNLTIEDGEMIGTFKTGDDDIQGNESSGHRSHRLILARHPFARLISGWKDKFRIENNYWTKFVARYPKIFQYRIHKPPANYTLAFEDFIQYVAENGHNLRNLEYHFVSATNLCRPCKYAYTYILKAERVDDDQAWLMNRINLTDMKVVRRGIAKGTLLQRNPSKLIKAWFENLSIDTIRKLYAIYRNDFFYFGYTFNFTSLESGGFD